MIFIYLIIGYLLGLGALVLYEVIIEKIEMKRLKNFKYIPDDNPSGIFSYYKGGANGKISDSVQSRSTKT